MSSQENVLLLGMVFSNELMPSIGQEFRDRVRCEALESLGYSVKTLDNKHLDTSMAHGKHCRTDFTCSRRMFKAMQSKWGSFQLDHVILDYFFSPAGWAATRWTDGLFKDTMVQLAQQNVLSPGGKIWLPNLQCIRESIDKFRPALDEYYTVHPVMDPSQNPLYVASENANDELLRCPDGGVVNQQAMQPILSQASFPFFALVSKVSSSQNQKIDDSTKNLSKQQKLEDHASRSLLMWDAIVAAPKQIGSTKVMCVFTGGKQSIQSGPFLYAVAEIQKKFPGTDLRVESMTTQELCARKLQPDQFVSWLMHSHVHLILGHVHQSLLTHNLRWDMTYAMLQYNRLKYHVGFPSGDQLQCPVFTQDKIKYIDCLGDLAVKTMTVSLTEDGKYDQRTLSDIQRYAIINI